MGAGVASIRAYYIGTKINMEMAKVIDIKATSSSSFAKILMTHN
jgi:hypothetical protein